MPETIETIESASAIVALGTAAILLLMGREDRDAAFPVFFAMLAASSAIMILCHIASTFTKGV